MNEGRTPILYVAPWVDLGGSDKGTIDWFRSIDREHWAPSLITTQPSANRWLHRLEPFVEEVWDLPDLMPGNAFPEFILGFVESRGVQVVHIMNARLGFDLLPDMARLAEPPSVVVQLHAEEPGQTGYVRYVTRRYANLIDAFSVTSYHLKEVVAGYDIPPSKIEVIHSGIDGEHEFNPTHVEPWELDDGVSRILWSGRLVEQKDPMLTLDVIARAREWGAEFVLDIVGDGHLEDAARCRAKQLGVGDAIKWHSPSQEMARWYRSADLLLMTSAYEGVPYVIYESLAMGVPVVAPALPGNQELMDTDSGVLIEPRDDVDRYAEAIVTLLADDERRRLMGEHSRRRMLTDFSLAEMSRRHSDLYERLLAGRPTVNRVAKVGDIRAPALQFPRDPPPAPTVGVIVPCYRHGIFLDACIDSIKAQTLRPDRIIVVDDGSDDVETLEVMARLEGDPEVSVLRQPRNLGPSAARNRALTELDTAYVLPIDADDELLPEALERMLGQLKSAPENVGFIYPDIQYMGNRSNYVRSPSYNLWLLMQQNYCPAPALFDRRVFDETSARYPEKVLVGHEDWDLILQLAERSVIGAPADGPTFRYRKQGFSRANAVDPAPEVFYQLVEERHPRLYERSDAIKACWAPALSIVLLDDEDGSWAERDLGGLATQTCKDFELLARMDLDGNAISVRDGAGLPVAWLQAAIHRARGRWVLLLSHAAVEVLETKSFVGQLLHSFVANENVLGEVLAEWAGPARHAFAQLDDLERLAAAPVGVAFERPSWGRLPELFLSGEDSLLADITVGLQAHGFLQWRLALSARSAVPQSRHLGERPAEKTSLDLNLPDQDSSETLTRRMMLHQDPRLPELEPSTPRRCKRSEPWMSPQSLLLCRHRDLTTGLRVITVGRKSPAGCVFERALGSAHRFPAPGAKRLIHSNGHFTTTGEQGELAEGEYDFGYIEQQALPMLLSLELRRVSGIGQEILVAGGDDPLAQGTEQIEVLGWIEAYPILPRAADVLHTGPWAVVSLCRQVDSRAWRHAYRVDQPGCEPADDLQLGSLRRYPGPGMVALRLRPDGRLASELCAPGRASRDPRKIGRWLAEPLSADNRTSARVRGTAARLRHLALHGRLRRMAEEDGEVLGYLPRQHMPGTSTLYSTIHPVTGDQLVTRSPEEATAAGYVMDGILGAIYDPPADALQQPHAMPWARIARG